MSYNQAKRIQVTPTDTTRLIVEQIHQKTGKARGAIISEILHEVTPVLQDMVKLIDKLESRPQLAQARLQSFIDEGHRQNQQLELQVEELLKKPKGRRLKRNQCIT